jgi:isoquinoline 1-oxidoreductase subunit beta
VRRREFIRLAAETGGALMLGTLLNQVQAASARSDVPITAWVRIAPSGEITLIASQSEMGQGISTTLAAALAH